MVRYREIRPSARLRSFVNRFWILEHDGHEVQPQRIVPDGHAELILNWRQPFEFLQNGQWHGQPHCFLAGQIEGPLLLRPKGPAKMLGIGFHPHGAARVFAAPMHELSGRFTPVDQLSTALARDLNQALESDRPIDAVESALLSSVRTSKNDLLVAEAVRRIVLARGGLDLAALARELGLSIRQLERRFQAAVGLPPKVFCRIERFTQVFRLLGEQSPDWVETAVLCGYYDQAHLIRECKSLSGGTPSVLLSEEADLARHFYSRFRVSHSSNTRRAGSR